MDALRGYGDRWIACINFGDPNYRPRRLFPIRGEAKEKKYKEVERGKYKE